MSYQDFLESTKPPSDQTAVEKSPSIISPAPAPTLVIHRKPPANYSTIPFTSSTGSVHNKVSQFNNLRSASISNPGPATNTNALMTKRSFSPSISAAPVTVTKYVVDPSPSSVYAPSRSTTPLSMSAPTHPPPPAPGPATNGHSEYPVPPAHAEWHAALKSCLALQTDAVIHHKKRPFAALLLGPDKTTTLLSHFSISHVQHAESELARLASLHYSTDYLMSCTLVSTWEPCAMCAGTIYWSGIGRVVYGARESKLKELTGPGNSENMTMDLPCRVVFNAGQSKVEVMGPMPGWEDKIFEESKKWWRDHKPQSGSTADPHITSGSDSIRSASIRSYTVVTNPPPDEGVLSRIGEDGEYKADLKVDWMIR